jgi:hypothetical protein
VLADQHEGRCDRYHVSFHDAPGVVSPLGPEPIMAADSRKRDGERCHITWRANLRAEYLDNLPLAALSAPLAIAIRSARERTQSAD